MQDVFPAGSFPKFPAIPQTPGMPEMPAITQKDSETSFRQVFNSINNQMAGNIQKPYQMAQEMMSGQQDFNSSELVMAIIKAEQQMRMYVRVMNDLIRQVKTLETIQA